MRTGLFVGIVAVLLQPLVARAQVGVPGAVAKPATPPPGSDGGVGSAVPTAPVAEVLAAPPADPPVVYVPAVIDTPSAPRFWGSAEYLLWWTKASPVPTPLASTGPLGTPGTAVLLGGQSYDMAAHSGGRFTLGAWLDPDATVGVEGTYLFLAPQTTFRAVGSNATVPLGLPYYDALLGAESFAALVFPGINAGGAYLSLTNRVQGGEINGSARLISNDRLSITGLAGFRYLDFDENLGFGFNAISPFAPGSLFAGFDRFNANNNFFGGQLGLRGEYRAGNWFINATGKCAFGDVAQIASVSGGFAAFTPIPPTFVTGVGGFFALPTNIGEHTHSAFAVLPEGTVNIGYDISPRVRVFAGYSILYISDVERPGTAIQHAINPSQSPGFGGSIGTLVGPGVPTYSFTRSDFWAQGLNFGVQMRY